MEIRACSWGRLPPEDDPVVYGDLHAMQTLKRHWAWMLRCRQCLGNSYRTHCFDCGLTLFKNGLRFTYHRTLADQITNVACPACGAHFDTDMRGLAQNAADSEPAG